MPTEKQESTLASPPPAKKLKQARLPFKVLSPKAVIQAPQVSPSPTQKKRKLSDQVTGPQKAAKTAKADENSPKSSKRTDADNEVSSSSEADPPIKGKHPEDPKPKPIGLLDKFVRTTQQLEVSTSSENGVVDLTDSDNEAEGKEVGIDSTKVDNIENIAPDSKTENSVDEKVLEKTSPDNSTRESSNKDELEEDMEVFNSSILSDSAGTEDKNDKKTEQTPKIKKSPSSVVPQKRSRKSSGLIEAEKQRKLEAKEKERLEKLQQKEREKAEREKKKQEEKEKKEQERLELKKKKEEEKQKQLEEKQKEKDEKMRQKEEERKKKQQEKEEEKKKKQEIIDAKNEDKRKKEEEKLRAEEEEKAKKDKEKNRFSQFFTKAEKQPAQPKPTVTNQGRFIAFELKKDMKMAPRIRVQEETRSTKMENVDRFLSNEEKPQSLYLDDLKNKKFKPGHSSKTWPYEIEVEIREAGVKSHLMRAKFLKFRENYRPAYYGTWRKKSSKVYARNPLGKDEDVFDYEVESDDEWEEEEPGESLSDSEKEDDEKEPVAEDDEEDEDGFFVPHGYLSEGEGCEDEDEEVSPERLKAKQLAKAKAWDAEVNAAGKKCEVLKPVCIGCCWWGLEGEMQRDPTWEKLEEFAAVPLFPTPISLQNTSETNSSSPGSKEKKKSKETRGTGNLMPVPDEALPDLLRLVHGNIFSIHKLVAEFQEYWRRKTLGLSLVNTEDNKTASESSQSEKASEPQGQSEAMDVSQSEETTKDKVDQSEEGGKTGQSDEPKCKISKRQLDTKIRSFAVYEKRDSFKRKCWYVHKDILEKHNLSDLPVPTKWHWLTRSNIKEVKKTVTEPTTPIQTNSKSHPQSASTPNIMQFAVAGYTPPIVIPSPVVQTKTPKENTIIQALQATPKSLPKSTPESNVASDTPKRLKDKLTPSALFSPQAAQLNTSISDVTPVKDVSVKTAHKDKNQPTLMSMLSSPQLAKKNPVNEVVQKSPQVIQIPDEKPGDSADTPMEID